MNPKKREIFTSPVIGRIDQGYIFCGGTSELYQDCDVLGIIITPRCDLAHDKTDEVYYLPIVHFKDWKNKEFPQLFCKKLLKDAEEKLEKALKSVSISPSIVQRFQEKDIDDIIKYYNLPKTDTQNIQKYLNTISQVKQYSVTKDLQLFEEILDNNKGFRKTIINDLIQNKLVNFYVLESKDDDGDYYIVRMRELQRIQTTIFRRMANGITFYDLTEAELKQNDIKIINPDDDLICPILVLKSPFIEHLMQCFAQWFSRIGIEDIDKSICDHIITNW